MFLVPQKKQLHMTFYYGLDSKTEWGAVSRVWHSQPWNVALAPSSLKLSG